MLFPLAPHPARYAPVASHPRRRVPASPGQVSKLTNDSESLRIARGAILYLAQMINIHEKVTQVPDSPGSLTMPMPVERTDTDLTELG